MRAIQFMKENGNDLKGVFDYYVTDIPEVMTPVVVSLFNNAGYTRHTMHDNDNRPFTTGKPYEEIVKTKVGYAFPTTLKFEPRFKRDKDTTVLFVGEFKRRNSRLEILSIDYIIRNVPRENVGKVMDFFRSYEDTLDFIVRKDLFEYKRDQAIDTKESTYRFLEEAWVMDYKDLATEKTYYLDI